MFGRRKIPQNSLIFHVISRYKLLNKLTYFCTICSNHIFCQCILRKVLRVWESDKGKRYEKKGDGQGNE